MRRSLAWLAAALVSASAGDAAAAEPATPSPATPESADPVDELIAAIRSTSPYDAADLVASDARFARLTAAERSRLLDGLREGPRWWAVVLNLYPGFGLGSMVSRDVRGVGLAAADIVGWTLFFVAAVEGMSGDFNSVDALLAAAGVLLVGSRVAGVVLPFTFHGRRHAEVENALRSLPPPLSVGPVIVPIARERGATGAALGLAFRF